MTVWTQSYRPFNWISTFHLLNILIIISTIQIILLMYRWNPSTLLMLQFLLWLSVKYGMCHFYQCHSWVKQQLHKWQDCWTHHTHGKPETCRVWSILVLSRTHSTESVLCFMSSPGLLHVTRLSIGIQHSLISE